jgi:diacylglycerol O-acyltransferase / wax synthase
MSNVLDPRDQASFDVWRATGANSLAQVIWVYNRPIDIDGLRKFHEHLRRGRLSRCIERSPLPFGRHRWVSPDRSPEIEIVASARPREEFDVWLNEQAIIPMDIEHGPGWHLAVLPFTDGGAGVSLVISHCLTDGLGLGEALADAAMGRDDPISWPAAGSRRRWQALREDARQTAHDIPAIGRAVVSAARLARRSRGGGGSANRMPPLPTGADERISFPTATIFVDADEWDARAHSLGGTSNALLAGLAARLAQRLGRVAADGSVTLRMPVNERVTGDTRANATAGIDITVYPEPATTDLREIRAAIKQALIRHRDVPDEERTVLSIIPLVPKRLFVRTVRMALTGASSLGVLNPAASRADGTEADYCAAKVLYSGVTKAMMHRNGGLQALVSGRALGQLFVSAIAYQPGRPNSNDGLRQDFVSALNDFSLTGTRL